MARFYDRPMSLAQHYALAKLIVNSRRRLATITRHTLSGRVPARVLDAALRVDRHLATVCWRLGESLGDHGVYAFDAPAIAPAPREKRRRLGVEEHRRLGAEVHRLRDDVSAVARAMQPYFALASPVRRAMHRPERELDRLRCLLDELFCRHHAAAFDPFVYYPGPAASGRTSLPMPGAVGPDSHAGVPEGERRINAAPPPPARHGASGGDQRAMVRDPQQPQPQGASHAD